MAMTKATGGTGGTQRLPVGNYKSDGWDRRDASSYIFLNDIFQAFTLKSHNAVKRRGKILLPILLISYAGLLLFFKCDYLPRNAVALTGLAAAPFIAWKISEKRSGRYGWLALGLAVGTAIFQSNMLFWFSTGFAVLFCIEAWRGKLNYLPAYLLVVISPVFRYVTDVWSFPIRLKMSELAAVALTRLGFGASAEGNVINVGGTAFLVDAACMGLQSLNTGLLMTLLLMAFFERKKRCPLGFWEAGAWLAMALAFAVAANFMRMLALVIFKVPAEDPMHDAWGLLAIGVYVLLPLFFLLKWRFSKVERKAESIVLTNFSPMFQAKNLGLNVAIFSLLAIGGWRHSQKKSAIPQPLNSIQLAGFQRTVQPDGVLKFENDTFLIYLKPPTNWLNASHDPRICWQGSGYEFKQVKKEKMEGFDTYTATLENGNDRLFSRWWYDNGTTLTLDEWSWRWSGILGNEKGFWLINLTATDEALLKKEAPLLHAKTRALFLMVNGKW